MDTLNFVVIEKKWLDELFNKISQVHHILNAERNDSAKVYTNKEACLYLNVCSKTLQNYRDTGQISFIQNGRKILYTQVELNAFLKKNKKDLFEKNIVKL